MPFLSHSHAPTYRLPQNNCVQLCAPDVKICALNVNHVQMTACLANHRHCHHIDESHTIFICFCNLHEEDEKYGKVTEWKIIMLAFSHATVVSVEKWNGFIYFESKESMCTVYVYSFLLSRLVVRHALKMSSIITKQGTQNAHTYACSTNLKTELFEL